MSDIIRRTIAFDCKGTLIFNNHNKKVVVDLFNDLHKNGHVMTIWSSLGSYPLKAYQEHFLGKENISLEDKSFYWGNEEGPPLKDICVDDENQTWLSAKHIIHAGKIPDKEVNPEAYKKLLIEIHTGDVNDNPDFLREYKL